MPPLRHTANARSLLVPQNPVEMEVERTPILTEFPTWPIRGPMATREGTRRLLRPFTHSLIPLLVNDAPSEHVGDGVDIDRRPRTPSEHAEEGVDIDRRTRIWYDDMVIEAPSPFVHLLDEEELLVLLSQELQTTKRPNEEKNNSDLQKPVDDSRMKRWRSSSAQIEQPSEASLRRLN